MGWRIAIGGMAIESSTFSPHRSGAADFTIVRGAELLMRHEPLPSGADWIPLVYARALPGGPVERPFYEMIKAELAERLQASLPLAGLLFDVHGAPPSIEGRPGIIDAAVWIGYAWADEPRCSGAIVVTGTDETAITREAAGLAKAYWDARARFDFSTAAGDADACIARGLASADRPFFISDSGDNPTAGGAGDVAFMLGRLLATPALASGEASAIWASCVDPVAVARCIDAGEGAAVDLMIGGTFGSPGPIRLRGSVRRLRRDEPVGGEMPAVGSG